MLPPHAARPVLPTPSTASPRRLPSSLSVVPPAPSPPFASSRASSIISGSSDTARELYGPDRLFGPPLVPLPGRQTQQPRPAQQAQQTQQEQQTQQQQTQQQQTQQEQQTQQQQTQQAQQAPPTLPQLPMFGHAMAPGPEGAVDDALAADSNIPLANPGQQFKDDLAREAGIVTPGVDDTPYILYALDVISGNFPPAMRRPLGAGQSASGVSSTATTPNTPSAPSLANAPGLAARDDSRRQDPISAGALGPPPPGPLPAVPPPVAMAGRRSRAPSGAPPVSLSGLVSGRPSQSSVSSVSTLVHSASLPPQPSLPAHKAKDAWVYLDRRHLSPEAQLVFPKANFRPAVLRPTSLVLLMLLALLMMAGLIFSAVYSRQHEGFVGYNGDNYGGQYFLFRVLPQLLAALVCLYTHAVYLALFRIRPFARMGAPSSSPYAAEHRGAIFDRLYPKSFLWPQVLGVGPWQHWVPFLIFWLMNFTVPIQSALFSVVNVDGQWRWAAVQGVAWTLVALYACLVLALVVVLVAWHQKQTGLLWDPRSIADIIVLASNSNTLADYRGTELLATRDELKTALSSRSFDKMGYWAWRDGRSNSVWHGIGSDLQDGDIAALWPASKKAEKQKSDKMEKKERKEKERLSSSPRWPSGDIATAAEAGIDIGIDIESLALSPHADQVRYRHLPWCLRTSQLLFFVVTALVLLVALFVVSFLPASHFSTGFLPQVQAAPTAGAFSAANFLYSFLPALLGQVLVLMFASLELSLRILQPWAELARHAGGVEPEASILADYAACLPLQGAWHAARNRHWRLAVLSLMAPLFALLLPVLGGGLFLALSVTTTAATKAGLTAEALMVPNMVLYGLVLALLVLYFACLAALLPGRKHLRFPHALTSISEIVSFCANDDLMREPAFKNVRSKAILRNQLDMDCPRSRRTRWIFGTGAFGNDQRLGVRRVRRYTELNRPSTRRPPLSV